MMVIITTVDIVVVLIDTDVVLVMELNYLKIHGRKRGTTGEKGSTLAKITEVSR